MKRKSAVSKICKLEVLLVTESDVTCLQKYNVVKYKNYRNVIRLNVGYEVLP